MINSFPVLWPDAGPRPLSPPPTLELGQSGARMGSEVTNERPRLRWPVVPSVVSLCPGHGAQLSQAAPGKHHQALDSGSDNDKFWAHNIPGKFLMGPN